MCTSELVNTKEGILLAKLYPKDIIRIEEDAIITGGSRQVYEAPRPSM